MSLTCVFDQLLREPVFASIIIPMLEVILDRHYIVYVAPYGHLRGKNFLSNWAYYTTLGMLARVN